jgi:hypothetical protein
MAIVNEQRVLATGQRWCPKAGGSWWTVVALSFDGQVTLSGPGPCRSVKYVKDEELFEDWKPKDGG